jgi:hypothetical protein
MSRLKGADLGISIPSNALNFRGLWSASPAPAYATNDVVLRNGVSYAAAMAPGSVDPQVNSTIVGGTDKNGTYGTLYSVAQQFTTGVSGSLVSAVTIAFSQAPAAGGAVRVGIASAVGANDGTITWVGATPSASTLPAAAGDVTFQLPAALTLAPSTTYYVVIQYVTSAAGNTYYIATPTYNGIVASATTLQYTNSIGGAWVTAGSGQRFYFSLIAAPWTPQGPTAPLNYRGAWAASVAYAANDLVTDAGKAWLANAAVPAGATYEPSLSPQYSGGASTTLASAVAALISSVNVTSMYQPFVPNANMTVNVIDVQFQGGAPAGSTARWGIATAIGSGDATITWLGATPNVIASPTSPGTLSIVLPAPIALVSGTTYYLVAQGVAGSGCNGVGYGTTPTLTGLSSESTGWGYTQSIGAVWSTTPRQIPFTLRSATGLSYWSPLTAAAEQVNGVGASAAAVTLPDVTVATIHRVVLTAACTLTFPTAAFGKSFTLALVQDATGSRTVTWPASVKWPGGTAPTLTTTANKTDVFSFVCVDGTNWIGTTRGQNL